MTTGHGGNLRALAARAGRPVAEILDFSANVNPLGPPEWLRAVISRHVEALVHYPDPDSSSLAEALARRHGVPREEVAVGNGSSELLYALPKALAASRAVIPVPSYIDYADAAQAAGLCVETLPLAESAGFELDAAALGSMLHGGEAVFLGQPNNPTGLLVERNALCRLAESHPSTVFVVDEAFADFVEGYETLASRRPANVAVVRSMTKFYAIPGIRLGYLVADAGIVGKVRELLVPWSVNTLAQAIGEAALGDEDYGQRTRAFVTERRESLIRALRQIPGLTVYPGRANFLLARLDRSEFDAPRLSDVLLRSDGIAIRDCSNYEGLDGRFFRVAVRTDEENDRLCRALDAALTKRPRATPKRKTATVMFQGTSSNAGKSILTAALCRILLQDGVRVAPFKSQNMSLNSFVTRDSGEMGRAQVVQAQACRLEPDVRMNPILLKPNSDTGCQVIVRGKPVGNMRVAEYIRYKPEAFAAAKECYDSLAAEFDAVVIEGAGSPGEVNLKSHDIVNMRMAQHAGAPVLIVGDIDRGGVFASFVGTMEVLAEWERAMVAGWVVNRFRGDVSLLGPALDYTLAHTGKPVLGVVPFLRDLNIPQEDSVEFKSGAMDDARASGHCVEIAVIDLPHISNFTDFDAFRVEADVRLRIVRSAADLGSPDAVILPGSKNTLADLGYLRASGLADRIAQLAAQGGPEIVGLCAGFQMLGREIGDPECIESTDGRSRGLGLLGVDTVMAPEKTLVLATARHRPSGLEVRGYEIHHGQTATGSLVPLFERADGQTLGVATADHRIWGTYLHGVFDADEFRRWFIDRLRARRGLPAVGQVTAHYDIESALDRLAAVMRQSLRVDEVYGLMGL